MAGRGWKDPLRAVIDLHTGGDRTGRSHIMQIYRLSWRHAGFRLARTNEAPQHSGKQGGQLKEPMLVHVVLS